METASIDAFFHEPFLPTPNRGLADPRRSNDLGHARAVRGEQHDPGAPDMLLGAVPVRRDRIQADAVGRADVYGDACSHPPDSYHRVPQGILLGPKRQISSTSIN